MNVMRSNKVGGSIMKVKRVYISFLMIAMLVIVFAGCGQKSASSEIHVTEAIMNVQAGLLMKRLLI